MREISPKITSHTSVVYLGPGSAGLAVVVTPEGCQRQGEGEEEHYHGGDEEAEDAVVLPSGTEHGRSIAHTNPVCPVLHKDIVEPPAAGSMFYIALC